MVNTGTIVFKDPDANTSFVVGSGATVGSLTLNKTAKVTVSSGATVSTLTVKAGATNTTIANSGTVTSVEANGDTTITGTAPTTVTGAGTVTGNALPTAPESAVKELLVEGLLASDVRYLAFNLNNDLDTAQKIASLEDVKTFVAGQYEGAVLATDKITVEDGKITVADGLLTTENWNKVKKNGNKVVPYQITVLNKDKTSKIAKIAMYQDGTVSIIKLP